VRIPSGEANLVLGADLVVSAANDALAKLNRETSHAVINSHLSPTADFTRDPDAVFPIDDMQDTISDEIGAGRGHFVNATRLANSLLGDAIFSNFMLLGVAYQHGLVPLDETSILQAIELNGVAVEKNQQAFLWGRRYVADAEAVRQAAGFEQPHQTPAEQSDLDEIVDYRASYLTDYQDQAYAERYRKLVDRVQKMERSLKGDDSTDSNGDFEKTLAAQFDGDFKLRFHLAPPLLAKRDAQTGVPLKREFGGWVMPLFRLLAGLKNLRGGALDIFGYSAERKQERKLITDYEQDIEQLFDAVNTDNFDLSVEIAGLPQKIRGFGHVKQASIESVAETRACQQALS
jgi:indolepyruvate ferredoxin oxidoreductase